MSPSRTGPLTLRIRERPAISVVAKNWTYQEQMSDEPKLESDVNNNNLLP